MRSFVFPGYVLYQPLVPYKQITQAYWGESSNTVKQRRGLNLRITYNSARSGFRPDLNPSDPAPAEKIFVQKFNVFKIMVKADY